MIHDLNLTGRNSKIHEIKTKQNGNRFMYGAMVALKCQTYIQNVKLFYCNVHTCNNVKIIRI